MVILLVETTTVQPVMIRWPLPLYRGALHDDRQQHAFDLGERVFDRAQVPVDPRLNAGRWLR